MPMQTIAISATFTADLLEAPLAFWMQELRLPARAVVAPYNQVFQQLLDPSSLLARNAAGVNVILVRLEDWRGSAQDAEPDELRDALGRTAEEFTTVLLAAAERSATPHLVVLCPASPLLADDPAIGPVLRAAEAIVRARLVGQAGLYVVGADEVRAAYPVQDWYDAIGEELGRIPYTPAYFTALATLLARRLRALWTPPRKVIAVDCDETLWAGVCGELGPQGITIDAPRRAFQEFLVAQQQAGMLVCLCSKNNEEDVWDVFASRPDMPLRREHLVGWRMNWQAKSANLRSLAQELGLGLDSFVFLDDNPVECAEVEANCPAVLTVPLPQPAECIQQFLQHLWAFDRLALTAEDRERTAQYHQNAARERFRRAAPTLTNFLAGLELQIHVFEPGPEALPRVAQLTQRTNQFNCTTIRRTEAELRQWRDAETGRCLAVEVCDRFGQYGLVGVLLYRNGAEAVEIDTFLLSCRVLGRGVEHALLRRLGEEAVGLGLARVDVPFVATQKNQPARDFLERVGARFRQDQPNGCAFRFPARVVTGLTFAGEAAPEEGATVGPAPVEAGAEPDAPSQLLVRIAQELADADAIVRAVHAQRRRARLGLTPNLPATPVAPRTPIEEALAGIWSEVLGIEPIGIHDDFFQLGGDSLLATQVVSRVRRRFHVQLPLRGLFEAATVAELAVSVVATLAEREHGEDVASLLDELDRMEAGELVLGLTESEQG
jgi:FkbH-like protein